MKCSLYLNIVPTRRNRDATNATEPISVTQLFLKKNLSPCLDTHLASISLIYCRIFLFCYCSRNVSAAGEIQPQKTRLFAVVVTAAFPKL